LIKGSSTDQCAASQPTHQLMIRTITTSLRSRPDGGGNGSIIGRNTFQRPEGAALEMLSKIIDIYLGNA
jgi:DhnA family fructose-bisphosphate aldolase class Ia